MRIRSPKDFWAGLSFVAIALAFVVLSSNYGLGNMHRMGPALFPVIVGTLLGSLGLIIAGRGLVIEGPPLPQFQARPILISLVAMVLFGVALTWHGLIAAIAVVVLVGAFASREARLQSTIVLAAGLILFSVAIFVWILGLPIPLWPGE
jgi:Tripartite tricarboxylate transporter TctB family